MERHFHQELEEVKEHLLRMGGRAEELIHKSVEALRRRDAALAQVVCDEDRFIDQLEIEIDERCVSLLALQQPMAGDLRFITSVLKISNDLERVGDHAVNIAEGVIRIADQPQGESITDISRMAELSMTMLREALDAFVHRDSATARRLVKRDDEVDGLNREIFGQLVKVMCADPESVARSLEMIRIAHNLERVADMATNIAEDVVFIAEARIIKHHHEELMDRGRQGSGGLGY